MTTDNPVKVTRTKIKSHEEVKTVSKAKEFEQEPIKATVKNVTIAEANRQLFNYMKTRGVSHATQVEPSKTIPSQISAKKTTS